MNWSHLKTFVWLRWRLMVNQSGRSGKVSLFIDMLIKIIIILTALAALFIGLMLGLIVFPTAPSNIIMAVWTAAMAGYLVFSMIGLINELQRSDLISLDKFMHLPVTPKGAFLINYLGSSINLSLLVFLFAMTGLTLGSFFSKGIGMLPLMPLVISFFLMVTALTYQFRGWLASMMTNPRRRRTIVVTMTLVFFLVMMLPILLGIMAKNGNHQAKDETPLVVEEQGTKSELGQSESERSKKFNTPFTDQEGYILLDRVRLTNAILPPGWLPFGVVSTLEGRIFPALACILGMALIGSLSLRRSYLTTIRMYTGYFDSTPVLKTSSATVEIQGDSKTTLSPATFLEKRIPWISEHASVITLASLRMMLRAPEMKLILLTPIVMLIVFGGMLGRMETTDSEFRQPLLAIGLAVFMLFMSTGQILGNMFAWDKDGFRVYVMSPASRRDVLLGKNLSFFPLALAMMFLAIFTSHWFSPMRPDHLLAVVLQTIPMYLIFCLSGNLLSILIPTVIKPGTGMPASGQGIKVLVSFIFMMLLPIPIVLTLMPLGLEFLMSVLDWHTSFPAFLVFGTIQVVLSIWLYSVILDSQGELLQRREQRILEVVTTRAE